MCHLSSRQVQLKYGLMGMLSWCHPYMIYVHVIYVYVMSSLLLIIMSVVQHSEQEVKVILDIVRFLQNKVYHVKLVLIQASVESHYKYSGISWDLNQDLLITRHCKPLDL